MIELISNYKFGICNTNEEYLNYINNSAVTTGAFVMYIKNNNKVKYTIITSPDSSEYPQIPEGNIKYNYVIYNIYNDNKKLVYNYKNNTGKIFTSVNDARANASAYLSNLNYNDPCDYFKIDIIYEKYNEQNIIIDTGTIDSFTYSLTVTSPITTKAPIIEDITTTPATTTTTTLNPDTTTTTTLNPDTTTTTTLNPDTTTTPSPDIIRYHYIIYSIYNDNEKLIYNYKNDTGYAFETINDTVSHANSYLCNLNYSDPYDYFRVDIIYEKYNNQQHIITDTSRIDSFIYLPTTTPKPADYNEFPTNDYTFMPVGVKIYTDNSQKSKENNKQLVDNYIDYNNMYKNVYGYPGDYIYVGCTVLYVNDIICNYEDIYMTYDSIDGGKLYFRDVSNIIYTISSDGTITQ